MIIISFRVKQQKKRRGYEEGRGTRGDTALTLGCLVEINSGTLLISKGSEQIKANTYFPSFSFSFSFSLLDTSQQAVQIGT